MKKFSIVVFIVLILIVLGWFIAGFWTGKPDDSENFYSPRASVEILPLPDDGRDSVVPSGENGNDEPGDENYVVPGEITVDDPDIDLENIQGDDTVYPDDVDPIVTTDETEEERSERRSIMLMQAEALYDSGRYEEALELLRADRTLLNDDTARLEDAIIAAMG